MGEEFEKEIRNKATICLLEQKRDELEEKLLKQLIASNELNKKIFNTKKELRDVLDMLSSISIEGKDKFEEQELEMDC